MENIGSFAVALVIADGLMLKYRLCPCIADAYRNGTADLPPSEYEGAILIGGKNEKTQ